MGDESEDTSATGNEQEESSAADDAPEIFLHPNAPPGAPPIGYDARGAIYLDGKKLQIAILTPDNPGDCPCIIDPGLLSTEGPFGVIGVLRRADFALGMGFTQAFAASNANAPRVVAPSYSKGLEQRFRGRKA